jgi:hypothetical protein
VVDSQTPCSPGRQRSASRNTRILYSAVNRLRVARTTTSGSVKGRDSPSTATSVKPVVFKRSPVPLALKTTLNSFRNLSHSMLTHRDLARVHGVARVLVKLGDIGASSLPRCNSRSDAGATNTRAKSSGTCSSGNAADRSDRRGAKGNLRYGQTRRLRCRSWQSIHIPKRRRDSHYYVGLSRLAAACCAGVGE